jgi:hypothetical protein
VLDAKTGQMVMDSRVSENALLNSSSTGQRPILADDNAFLGASGLEGRSGLSTQGDTRVAFAAVSNAPQDFGSLWVVVASSPAVGVSGWLGSLGWLALTLLIGGLVLIASGCVASVRVHRQIRLTSEQHLQQSLHDPLTGLPNRALFADRGQQAIAGAKRSGGSAAVLLIDLDHFKEVNDTLGHPAGDQLLVTLSGRLQAPCVRSTPSPAWAGTSS